MFTGLVEEVGRVARVERRGAWQELTISAHRVVEDTRPGDSIAIDGVCQTVSALHGNSFTVETLEVSLEKTTLGALRPGDRVNLERALTLATRLGGHLVQGHVDGVAVIHAVRRHGPNGYLQVEIPRELLRYCVREGSITLQGVSLTIATLEDPLVTVNVIPVTWETTTLGECRPGGRINLEVDILGRYVERLLQGRTGEVGAAEEAGRDTRGLSQEQLLRWGYS